MASIDLITTGMNNKARAESVPEGKARNAVNVQFDDAGKTIIPRQGSTLQYSGSDIHSVLESEVATVFVEAGVLKRLDGINLATAYLPGVGKNHVSYANKTIAGEVYFANDLVRGKFDKNGAYPWSTPRPTHQPDCAAGSFGGMYAGDYRVAITWIGGEESGTGAGRRVTVPDGGGIRVYNLPVTPAGVTLVAVYVSSTNSKDMYLYGEYPANTAEVYINRLTSAGAIPTIALETQFCYPPTPIDLIVLHYGRIYYPRGGYLYWTIPGRYSLQRANSFWDFGKDIQTVVSCPGVLYIGTSETLYKVTNIDGEGGALVEELQDCGTTKGSECYDPDGVSAYFMSDRGFIKATPEGLTELSYTDVAIPHFDIGTMTVTEYDGLKYLIGTFQKGVQNPLANKDYNTAELARGSL